MIPIGYYFFTFANIIYIDVYSVGEDAMKFMTTKDYDEKCGGTPRHMEVLTAVRQTPCVWLLGKAKLIPFDSEKPFSGLTLNKITFGID